MSFQDLLCCWQHSVLCGCRTGFFISLLAVSWGPSQFLETACCPQLFRLSKKRWIPLRLWIFSFSATEWKNALIFKGFIYFLQAHVDNHPMSRSTVPSHNLITGVKIHDIHSLTDYAGHVLQMGGVSGAISEFCLPHQ